MDFMFIAKRMWNLQPRRNDQAGSGITWGLNSHAMTADRSVRKQKRLQEGLEGSGSRLVQRQADKTGLGSVPVHSK